MSVGRCAFDRCQAGGDILPGAPKMTELVGFFGPGAGWIEGFREYHPGCWDAELQAEDRLHGPTDVRASKESAHA